MTQSGTRFLRSRGFAAALALLTLTLAAAGASAQNKPTGFAALTVEPSRLDFGRMERNETRTRDLLLRNDGGIPLEISEVTASCGCTVPELTKRSLKPGESTKLTVTFSSKTFQGQQDKFVVIKSNDAASPSLQVDVSAFVHVPIEVQPERLQLAFPRVLHGETGTPEVVEFRAVDQPRLELKVLRARADLFETRLEQGIDGDPRRGKLTLTLRRDAPYGPISEVVRIGTNDPAMSTIDFEVIGDVMRELEASPPQVNFRYLERDREVRYDIRVRPIKSGLTYKVLDATIDMPEFRVTVKETAPNQETVITIKGYPIAVTDPRAVAAQGRMQGTLRIRTNLPSQPELEVKVTYLLRM